MYDDYRFKCEVRHILKLRILGKYEVDKHLNLVEKMRGKDARYKLQDEAKKQWERGNRGKYDDWKT